MKTTSVDNSEILQQAQEIGLLTELFDDIDFSDDLTRIEMACP